MKPRDYCKKALVHACIYFTACTLLMLLIYVLLKLDLTRGINPIAQVTIFVFSVLFAAANLCYRESKMSKLSRLALHYLLTVGGAFVCLYLPNRSTSQTAFQAFALFVGFTLIYAIVMGTILGVSARIHRVKRDEAQYHNVYKKVYKKK